MKRIVLGLLIICSVSSVFAISSQHLYYKSSYEYESVETLCRIAGVLGPSSVEPIPAKELIAALDRIDETKLAQTSKEEYLHIKSMLTTRNELDSEILIWLSPQVFIVDDYINTSRDDFFIPFRDEKPFLGMALEFDMGDNVYLDGELVATGKPFSSGMPVTNLDWLINYRNGRWNILSDGSSSSFFENLPNKARLSIGNTWINFTFGRTRHSMGSGITGNMLVGDNFPYQELALLSFNANWFSYYISVTHFNNQTGVDTFDNVRFGGMHQSRVVHRFGFGLSDSFRIILNLGNTLYVDSAFDIRWFSPFSIAHNYYNYNGDSYEVTPEDEANNILSLELEWAICRGVSAGAQFVLDQFQLKNETGELPMAAGVLTNIQWTGAVPNGFMSVWGEFVYTTPYLYLNEKWRDGNPDYNFDHIYGYHMTRSSKPMIGYSGYSFGPDTILVSLGYEWQNHLIGLDFEAYTLYKTQGEKSYLDPDLDNGQFEGINTPSGIAEHELSFCAFVRWSGTMDCLEIFGGMDFTFRWNNNHVRGEFKFLPQCCIGLVWNMISL